MLKFLILWLLLFTCSISYCQSKVNVVTNQWNDKYMLIVGTEKICAAISYSHMLFHDSIQWGKVKESALTVIFEPTSFH